MTITSKEALLASIDASKAKSTKLLQDLIRAASPNPPGDTLAAAEVITRYLDGHNVPHSTISPDGPNRPNIVSTFSLHNRSNKGDVAAERVVLNGHLDHFPVDPAEIPKWSHGGPYSGHHDTEKGFIYGRGGVDMKAGTAAMAIVYAHLYANLDGASITANSNNNDSLTLTIVSDEETGGKYGAKHLLYDHPDKETWRGTVMLNAEPGGVNSIRFAEKGTLRITFIIRTLGAHGAYLHLSEGANRIAARFITALLSVEDLEPPELPNEIRDLVKSYKVRRAMDKVMGDGAGDLALKTTVNIGVLKGGVKVNTIPSSCEVQADIRLPIGMTKEFVLSHIQQHILGDFPEVQMIVQEAASNPSSWCDPHHEIVGLLKTNAEDIVGGEIVPIPGLGATDTKFWRYVGVPAYVFGISPETMAGVDERVIVEEFLEVVRVHAATVWDYLVGE